MPHSDDDFTTPIDPADFAQATSGAVLKGNLLADLRRAFKARAKAADTSARKPGSKITLKANITDEFIQVQRTYDIEDDAADTFRPMVILDRGGPSSVAGLQCRIGRRTTTWQFERDIVRHGKRTFTSVTLGHWPDMTVAQARERAAIAGGKVASGAYVSNREGPKFGEAYERYLEWLSFKAQDRGLAIVQQDGKITSLARRKTEQVGKRLLLPEFENTPLVAIEPAHVADWHKRLVRETSITQANAAVRILRAIHNREHKRYPKILPATAPTMAVDFVTEDWQRDGADKPGIDNFKEWRAGLDKLNPLRRAYHLCTLLTGMRGGAMARAKWADVDVRKRTLSIRNKGGQSTITVPLSAAIARVLQAARDHGAEHAKLTRVKQGDLIFPTCAHAPQHDTDLPVRGHGLRRTWKTVATSLGIDDTLSGLMIGHKPKGMSQEYVRRLALMQSNEMRRYQARISKRITELLGQPEYPIRGKR